jgi:hypothetical protein
MAFKSKCKCMRMLESGWRIERKEEVSWKIQLETFVKMGLGKIITAYTFVYISSYVTSELYKK